MYCCLNMRLIILVFIINYLWKFTMAAKRSTTVYFTGWKTTFNPEFISSYDIKILPKTPGTTLNMDFTVIRNYTYDPIMQIVVRMKYPNSEDYRNVFTFDFDYCNFFGFKEKPRNVIEMHAFNMLDIWTSNIKEFGVMPTCPVHVGHYKLRNLKADKRSVPPFVASGQFRVDCLNFFKGVVPRIYVTNASIFIAVKRK